ncbi:hypothetical protein L228DRAFT_50055 [Xylona heveae TC161]|uniref:Uncharacterized protein n=1 Tax=Xylona heveae (strain CBS 132557 / TC161) TaxID=1328760 RepID=A0A164ZMJ3_XYLHT|nr:hypothetical protein L228DRAFT_50055 [Xylona heveae TC161]KZF19283.1 hypothetical protein L228DRAFT_50055 [Xylona heveae TC161]
MPVIDLSLEPGSDSEARKKLLLAHWGTTAQREHLSKWLAEFQKDLAKAQAEASIASAEAAAHATPTSEPPAYGIQTAAPAAIDPETSSVEIIQSPPITSVPAVLVEAPSEQNSPTVEKPAHGKPPVQKLTAEETELEQPAMEKIATEKKIPEQSVEDQPSVEKPVALKPSREHSASEETVVEKPVESLLINIPPPPSEGHKAKAAEGILPDKLVTSVKAVPVHATPTAVIDMRPNSVNRDPDSPVRFASSQTTVASVHTTTERLQSVPSSGGDSILFQPNIFILVLVVICAVLYRKWRSRPREVLIGEKGARGLA